MYASLEHAHSRLWHSTRRQIVPTPHLGCDMLFVHWRRLTGKSERTNEYLCLCVRLEARPACIYETDV